MKDSVTKQPVFRSTVRTAYGIQICSTKQMTASNLRSSFSKWGQITGFELPLKPYAFRRGNGEALDSLGKSGSDSRPLRNTIERADFASVY